MKGNAVYKFASLAVLLLLLLIAAFLWFNRNTENTPIREPVPLNPVEFGLPETAREVIEKRTEKTVTFEVEPGKYAAVSMGRVMFEQNERGQWVLIEEQQ